MSASSRFGGGCIGCADVPGLLAVQGEEDLVDCFLPACLTWADVADVDWAVSAGGVPRVLKAKRSRSSLEKPWLIGMPAA